jgi:hypothetical protein
MKNTKLILFGGIASALLSCTPVEPSAGQTTAIEGVWMTYSADYPAVPNIQADWILFFNNGKSLTTMPDYGLHNYNINNETSAIDLGTYTFNGANGQNTKGQSTSSITLVSGKELKIDNRTFFKCAPVEGMKLSGTYTTYADATDPDLQTLPYGQNPKIVFDANGNFNDWGIYNTLLFNLFSDPAVAQAGAGTYEIKNYSILLHYADGRERQESINQFLSTNDANANIVYIRKIRLNKIP